MGIVRGVLTARRGSRPSAVGLVAENVIRCLAAAALMIAGVRDPVAYGVCLLVGYVAVLAWPSSFRLGRTARPAARSPR